ncbi:MAG: hypothetical protein ACFB21_13250 [Opitutales bacterium]
MEALKKKFLYPVGRELRAYLRQYGRERPLPIHYARLREAFESMPLYDHHGNDTLWHTFIYDRDAWPEIDAALTQTYALLKAPANLSIAEHLRCDRVDFCSFGNSQPFRIRIRNKYNDNHDYFYVKRADSSRIYGLELEEVLSPNSINFLVDHETIVEQHIIGVPGDAFIENYFHREDLNKVRIAKEFIKFSERCFVRLLGDMRSYNYVMRMTPDFDDRQYRVRTIDFDQQSYEGRHRHYLPQFFKENKPVVELCLEVLDPRSIEQYRDEERSLIGRRAATSPHRLSQLRAIMCGDRISEPEKVHQLAQELAAYHDHEDLLRCESMGALTFAHLDLMLAKAGSFPLAR